MNHRSRNQERNVEARRRSFGQGIERSALEQQAIAQQKQNARRDLLSIDAPTRERLKAGNPPKSV
jgi:hypothetical protein